MSKNKEECPRSTILAAAKDIFMQKGYTGTRTQEIADKAGINKAMLHYYFGNKEKLFRVILTEAGQIMAPMMKSTLLSEKGVLAKLEDLVTNHISTLLKYPHLPMFLMSELSQNQGKFMIEIIEQEKLQPTMAAFFQQVVEEGEAGVIRKVDPMHLLINVMSMIEFPFVMRPMITSIGESTEGDYQTVLEQRAAQIIQFLHAALRPE